GVLGLPGPPRGGVAPRRDRPGKRAGTRARGTLFARVAAYAPASEWRSPDRARLPARPPCWHGAARDPGPASRWGTALSGGGDGVCSGAAEGARGPGEWIRSK